MFFKKIIFSILSFFIIASTGLSAQQSPNMTPESVEREAFNAPPYEIESVAFEELGFPVTLSTQDLGYEYVLLWDGKRMPDTDKVYGKNELDQMPLFSSDCRNAKDKAACSNEAINEYLNENLNYPDKALMKDHDGLEKVFFVLDENGKIEGNIKILSKDNPCKGCAEAAVEAVANMPAWVPGMKRGIPVKTKVILPIKFKTL